MVVDVLIMLVPNPQQASELLQERVAAAFEKLKERSALQFLSERRLRDMAYRQKGREADLDQLSDLCELDMPDRRDLDDAVLEMLGVADPARRQALIDELYAYLRQFFEWTRRKEEKAILNKLTARRQVKVSPAAVAAQILAEIETDHPLLLRRYDPDFLDASQPSDVYDLPLEGDPSPLEGLFQENSVVFLKGKKRLALVSLAIAEQVPLVVLLASHGLRGLVLLPHEAGECRRLTHAYQEFLYQRDAAVKELIARRTADEDLQEKIYSALLRVLINK